MDRNAKDRERYATDETYREKKKERNKAQFQKHKEKRRQYTRERRQNRRKILIEHLGGKCKGCGTTENLQFDHLDRTQKSFTIAKCLDYSMEKLIAEVDKCQLLCYNCHEVKSLINHDKDKLAEGYRVTSVDRIGDEIVVRLRPVQKAPKMLLGGMYAIMSISTAKSVQAVVDTVFKQGQPAISVIRR